MWEMVSEWAKDYFTNGENLTEIVNGLVIAFIGVIGGASLLWIKNRKKSEIAKQQLSEELEKPKPKHATKIGIVKSKGPGMDEIRRKKF